MYMENNAKSEVAQRYVDILTNAGFKAVFGDVANKDAVMMIINQFLPKNRKVEHIDYLPTNYQGPNWRKALSRDWRKDWRKAAQREYSKAALKNEPIWF